MGKNYTIYIRSSDQSEWEALEHRGDFIHEALQRERISDGYSMQDLKDGKPQADIKKMSGIPDTSIGESNPYKWGDTNTAPIEPLVDKLNKVTGGIKTCKHGSDPELCKFAKVVNGKKVCK